MKTQSILSRCGYQLLTYTFALGIGLCLFSHPSHAASANPLKKLLGECYEPTLPESAGDSEDIYVNHHKLSEAQAQNVRWISHCVVPFLPGTLPEKIDLAAKVTWWTLREGTLEMNAEKLFRYSNCHEKARVTKKGKHIRGVDTIRSNWPLYNCSTNIWQVGIMAGQVANYQDSEVKEKFDDIFGQLDPSITQKEVLEWTASLAGYPAGTPTSREIMNSTGRVKRSWFIRNPLIGMMLTIREVEDECLRDGRGWCFKGRYDDAVHFSHTKIGMKEAISDLNAFFQKRD